jgi:hypothetical protein
MQRRATAAPAPPSTVLYLAHQVEVRRVSKAARERGWGLDQEHIAGPQHDVTDLALHAFAVAVDGQHRGAVTAPEAGVANVLAHEWRALCHDGLVHAPLLVLSRRLVLRGGHEPSKLLQIDDRVDHSGERESVTQL